MRLKARSCRVREAARSAARSICSIFFARDVNRGRQNVQEQLGMAFDDHQKIIEVVCNSAGQAGRSLPFFAPDEVVVPGADAR